MISTRRILLIASVPLLLSIGGFAGAYLTRHSERAGSEVRAQTEDNEERESSFRSVDSIHESRSSRLENRGVSGAPISSDVFSAAAVAKDEKYLREVPYATLKRVYFEREDAESLKMADHFDTFDENDLEAKKRRSDSLLALYAEYGSGQSYFMSSGEWTLRNGKRVPYTVLASLYSSVSSDDEGWSIQGNAKEATQGNELCYGTAVYIKTGDRYLSQTVSSCVGWAKTRAGRPYTNQGVYIDKELVGYFDSLSLPIPGFGPDSEGDPQWYDATTAKWNSLGKINWDPITKEESRRRTKELDDQTIKTGF